MVLRVLIKEHGAHRLQFYLMQMDKSSLEPASNILTLPVGQRDHMRGADHPKITIVEYGDYECMYCGAAYPILKRIERTYSDSLRFVFRNFPLSDLHENAQLAAESAESAGNQDKFWEMHDMLYENQDRLDYDALLGYAQTLGLDLERFELDLDEHRTAHRVEEDYESGITSGIEGTPTLFIDDKMYEGPIQEDSLIEELEQRIRNKERRSRRAA